jgi:hypothetical protein
LSTLTFQAAPAFGVGVFDFHGALRHDLPAVGKCFDEFVATDREVALTPPPTTRRVKHFRAALRREAPRLAAMASMVSDELDMGLRSSAVIRNVGLADADLDDQRKALYALATLVGVPTPTSSNKQVLWDVRPRQETFAADYYQTFSETDEEAFYHTDSSFKRRPEDAFLLYCVRPDQTGGGVSRLIDGRSLIHSLLHDPATRPLYTHLSSVEIPAITPDTLMLPGDSRYQMLRVFDRSPMVRFRKDTLLEGLAAFPSERAEESVEVIQQLVELLKVYPAAEHELGADELIFVDNHTALHARTAIGDRERHLIRVRVRLQPNAR